MLTRGHLNGANKIKKDANKFLKDLVLNPGRECDVILASICCGKQAFL